jgi:acylphosphatase
VFHVKHDRTNPEDRRIRLVAYGTVQGVGFRWFVRRAALDLNLAGYVLNRPDGSVEIEAAGPDPALEQLRRTVEHGPRLARVERVESLEPGSDELPAPFAVR